MTGTDDSARDPVDLLSEEFLRRVRAGETVTIESFAAAHPDHAATLRELLPTLLLLEGARVERASTGSGRGRLTVPKLERLGDYKIVREVGRGGMGIVFEAVQESLGRRVALKVLPQSSLLAGNQLQRFQREAHTAARLHHSNIVPVFGSGEHDGYHFYAMQFIDGRGLDAWIGERAASAPGDADAQRERGRFAARVVAEAAAALQYAHGQGTLHRDIKPANLLLDREEHVWVTDFGLAKALEADGLTRSGDVLGTLQYMAPEQFDGGYDVRSEVYALGLVLYELIALRPAVTGRTRSEILERIRAGKPERLGRAVPAVPRDLETIVHKAIAREPGDRYADAGALQRDLEAFRQDQPIAARRQSTVEQLGRWCRQNRALAVLTACTFLAVSGAAIGGWFAYGTTNRALARAENDERAARQAEHRAEANLGLALQVFDDVFDTLVGPDPMQAVETDPDTGEEEFVGRPPVSARDLGLLQRMLTFYDRFAAENAGSPALTAETAQAWRRVGAIQARLGDREKALAAYQKALDRYREIHDRDTARVVGSVHVEIGLLLLQQGGRSSEEAVMRFEAALQLLETAKEPGRGVRFERARAHFLLARARLSRRFAGPRPDAPPGEQHPEPLRPDPAREAARQQELAVRAAAKAELQAAQALLADLLREEPQNPAYLALHARCLITAPRVEAPGGAIPESTPGFREGLAILRTLVQQHPEETSCRFELASALVGEQRRRRGSPGGGREPAFANRPAAAVAEAAAVAAAEEAVEQATALVKIQPEHTEFQFLFARAHEALGVALLLGRQRNDAQRVAGESSLRVALETVEALLAKPEPPEGRAVDLALGLRMELARERFRRGDPAAAREQLTAAVRLVQQMTGRGGRGRPQPWLDHLRVMSEFADDHGFGDVIRPLRDLIDRLPPRRR